MRRITDTAAARTRARLFRQFIQCRSVSLFASSGEASRPVSSVNQALQQTILQRLLALDDGDPAFLADLLESFLSTTPEILAAMQEHWAQRDAEGLHNQAHTLKSSAQLIGLDRLAGLCLHLEQATKDAADPSGVGNVVEEIVRTYEQAAPTLAHLHASLAGTTQ
ncbi:MAG: hypothetical protein KatS3mg044_0197 [Rhodothermaceae bacterium]|nr:MAG: hypothetical protein KatS3mg044_0197 [Rhodothermaceae bacterium]